MKLTLPLNLEETDKSHLTWGAPANVSNLSVTPPPGTTELVIDVTPTLDSIRYTGPQPIEGGVGVCEQPAFLSIGAVATLVTADGGLNESVSVLVGAHDASSAVLSATLSAANIAGTFRVQDTMIWDETSLALTTTFDGAGAHGNITYSASKSFATGPNSGEGLGLMAPVAVWLPEVDGASPEQPDAAVDGQGDAQPAD